MTMGKRNFMGASGPRARKKAKTGAKCMQISSALLAQYSITPKMWCHQDTRRNTGGRDDDPDD
jgi:hypothetical protein